MQLNEDIKMIRRWRKSPPPIDMEQDLTLENMSFRVVKSPLDVRDWNAEKKALQSGGKGTSYSIPEVYDLRKYMLPVRCQGKLSTCAAFSAACIKEYQERMEWKCKRYFSPQFLYNNRSNEKIKGMYLRDVLKILHKKGCCFEDDYRYMEKFERYETICDDVKTKANNFRIQAYGRLYKVKCVKQSLIENGPCLIGVPVYNTTSRLWLKTHEDQKMIGGHCMVIVGYNNQGFIVRNSWGTRWGIDGYTILPYEDWSSIWECWTTIDHVVDDVDVHSGLRKKKKAPIFAKVKLALKNTFECVLRLFGCKRHENDDDYQWNSDSDSDDEEV